MLLWGWLEEKTKIRYNTIIHILLISLQVTETRTGPLGCSNYDNLDTVSSVLVHSPENKVQLQGKTSLDGNGDIGNSQIYELSFDNCNK